MTNNSNNPRKTKGLFLCVYFMTVNFHLHWVTDLTPSLGKLKS